MRLKLKTAVAAVLCVILTAALITVFAAEDYSVAAPGDFTVVYTGEDMQPAADIIGVSASELKSLCRENDVMFVAVNKDNTVQIRLSRYKTELSRYKTELSEKMEDMSYVSDNLQSELAAEQGENYVKTTLGNTAYLKTTEQLSDSGGDYTTEQYVTVKNGCVYHLSVYYSSGADTSAAQDFLNGVRIHRAVVYSNKQKILVIAAISAFVILIAFMVRGIIKDIKSGKEGENAVDTQGEQ